ncbi:MAG: hypothetical protein HeimC2_35720 [Candidatus Heimdallarchaeota archaeon LC_2]|nr:MAG: hypothetical protein HeimC2_35720 [Candidatus Heimdallarchaeota archaeon LC_2]
MVSNSSPIEQQTSNHHPIDYEETPSIITNDLDRLLEYNITNLTTSKIREHRNKLHQLSEFARLSRIQVHFIGLIDLQKKFAPHNCCTWFSGHDYHPECDLVQILSAIQSQSMVSPRKYKIKLVY